MGYFAGVCLLGGAKDPRQQAIEQRARVVEPEIGAKYRHQQGNDDPPPHQAHMPLVLGLLLPAEGFRLFQRGGTLIAV
jgi:hypothetical protein